MYEEHLTQAGLTKEQATLYAILLKNGPLTARKIQQKSPFKRGLVYKILDDLISLGLISKQNEPRKVSLFSPAHPSKLKDLSEKRERAAKEAQQSLLSILPLLVSDFNFISGTPGISFYEGMEGLERIYDDIVATKKDLMLFRSPFDDDHPELARLVSQQIKRQVRANIRTLALTPLVPDTPATILSKDEANLVTRRIMPRERFLLGSQIIIYGHKVAITAFKNSVFTTLIDNENIADTFRTIFQYIWVAAEPEHQKIYGQIMQPAESPVPTRQEPDVKSPPTP